jgi:hypothetical protein
LLVGVMGQFTAVGDDDQSIYAWRGAKPENMALLNEDLEGTRFTPEKHAQQQSPYQNLLKPKAGGLALALNILGNDIDALVDMTIVYPDGAPGYSEFWLGEVPRIAVNLRKIDIPAWVLAGNYEDDADFREKFQQWVDQLWTEKDQLIEKMKAKYSKSNLTQ